MLLKLKTLSLNFKISNSLFIAIFKIITYSNYTLYTSKFAYSS